MSHSHLPDWVNEQLQGEWFYCPRQLRPEDHYRAQVRCTTCPFELRICRRHLEPIHKHKKPWKCQACEEEGVLFVDTRMPGKSIIELVDEIKLANELRGR